MADTRGGWIKLYWRTKDSLMASSAVSLGLWAHILLSVAHRPTLLRNGARLEIGEALLSTKDLAKWAGVTDRTLRRYIKAMEEEGAIRVLKRDRNGTRVSVCNWRLYQDSESDTVREATAIDNATTTKAQRNGAQTESPKSPKSPETRKGPAATVAANPPRVEEVAAYCESRGNAVDAEAFVAHYRANGWKQSSGRPIVDWESAVITWEKRHNQRGSPGGPHPNRRGEIPATEADLQQAFACHD